MSFYYYYTLCMLQFLHWNAIVVETRTAIERNVLRHQNSVKNMQMHACQWFGGKVRNSGCFMVFDKFTKWSLICCICCCTGYRTTLNMVLFMVGYISNIYSHLVRMSW